MTTHPTGHAPTASFGEVLKHYRLATALTQEELAERAGVSRLTISALERGIRHVPHKDTLQRLTDALHLPARDRNRLQNAARKGAHDPLFALNGYADGHSSFTLPPLVGRRREMDLVEHHIEGDGPPMLVIAGEPGIGKTRLLAEAEMHAGRYGFRVLHGDSHRTRLEEPYAPLSDALAHHLYSQAPAQRRGVVRAFPPLARLLPELAVDLVDPLPSLPRDGELRLMIGALAEYLVSPGADGEARVLGTLLVLDDLQWSGADALELLSALIRFRHVSAGSHAPLRIIGAYRDTETHAGDSLSTVLADLEPGRLTTEVSLGPLELDESAHLVDLLLKGSTRSTIDPIVHTAGGVPFFLICLAQEACRGKDGVPPDVIQSIRSRIMPLTEDTRRLLEVASLMGSEVSHTRLTQFFGQNESTVASALDLLHRSKLLIAGGEAFSRFPNDVIRQVVEEEIGSASRTVLQRRLATERGSE